MFRFIHSSDLHIGKRFGNLPEELRGRLRDARHTVLDRLAEQARAAGAGTVLLAGDCFDTETPSPAMLRQALAAMAGHAGLRWVMLPGNHDSLLADELWAAARAALPGNVMLATEAEPIMLEPRIALLPVLIGLFFIESSTAAWTALWIYIFCAVTDFFDGYLARKMGITSNFGTFLDPISDKIMVASLLISTGLTAAELVEAALRPIQ